MAQYRLCKCFYCKEDIDRNTETDWEQLDNGRYAHSACAEEHNKNQEYHDKIHSKMKSLCGNAYVKTKIENQIKKFKNENDLTEEQIYNALVYFFEVKQNDPTQANGGIGIVPYIITDSEEYWMNKTIREEQSKKVDKGLIQRIKEFAARRPAKMDKRFVIQKPKHVNYLDDK